MKVTALKLQQRNKNRVNVYLDGKFAFALAKIIAARLTTGQELDESAAERLRATDGVEAAYERALRFLGVRPRSEAEVRRRLKQAGLDPGVIDEVVQRLGRVGLVDDQAFAAYWVENRVAFRPRSRRALRVELKQKGVSDEVLKQALTVADDAASAYSVAAKHARRLAALPHQDFRRKLGDFLARRGFDYDTIAPVVARVWKETHGQADDE